MGFLVCFALASPLDLDNHPLCCLGIGQHYHWFGNHLVERRPGGSMVSRKISGQRKQKYPRVETNHATRTTEMPHRYSCHRYAVRVISEHRSGDAKEVVQQ